MLSRCHHGKQYYVVGLTTKLEGKVDLDATEMVR